MPFYILFYTNPKQEGYMQWLRGFKPDCLRRGRHPISLCSWPCYGYRDCGDLQEDWKQYTLESGA